MSTPHHHPVFRPRPRTASIQTTITHPGSVRINVQGAFIVDDEPDVAAGPGTHTGNGHGHGHGHDIRLPNHTAVVSHVALDIGGSLAKLVYFSRERHSTEPGGRLNFVNFETSKIEACLAFVQHLQARQHALYAGSTSSDLCVMATGGGAYKYYEQLKEVLGVPVRREDEMECLIIGLDFFITEIPHEVFTYSSSSSSNDATTAADAGVAADEPMRFVEARADIYPYLLVNIGSGVSMIKVSGPRHFERIGGTSLGGGTLWGLLSLLTGARTFDDMLAMADRGDNTAVDMLVGDIYGADYGKIGLKSSTIASSFGRVFRIMRDAERDAEDGSGLMNGDDAHQDRIHPDIAAVAGDDDRVPNPVSFKPEDISRSLLYAISNNIGQIAYLQSEKHQLANIYFGGSFIRGHRQTIHTLSYAIKFWSKGLQRAYFLRHEGYLGAVGAFLKRQPRNWGRRNSFEELRPADDGREGRGATSKEG
ncbi:MAG: hypothetical protein M1826_005768 [Phylliscum demangeonii]|nr:MAG: hypothetical protein M1826_005768 [Phylliscum demangeonii]